MLNLDLFIPAQIRTALEHPLAKNLELPLPNSQQASQAEIRAIQQRDRIPGIVKRLIPLDSTIYWEYWWCVPGRILLPEDAELLQRDRPRVEATPKPNSFGFGVDTALGTRRAATKSVNRSTIGSR